MIDLGSKLRQVSSSPPRFGEGPGEGFFGDEFS
jgi:hypothetical protein